MYSVTYILGGSLIVVTSPSMASAFKTFWAFRCKAKLAARLWYTGKGETVKMIF